MLLNVIKIGKIDVHNKLEVKMVERKLLCKGNSIV